MSDEAQDGTAPQSLTDAERERLDTLRRVLRIRIDGEWDEDLMEAAFDRLERLLARPGGEEVPAVEAADAAARTSRRSGSAGRRRGRRG